MSKQILNPYSPPEVTADRAARFRVVGHLVGVVGFLIGLAPTLIVLYSLGETWIALADSPSTSVRPWGIMVLGAKWLAINVFFCLPLSCGFANVAKRCGSQPGHIGALSSTVFCPFPLILALLGPLVIAWGTGSSFGN